MRRKLLPLVLAGLAMLASASTVAAAGSSGGCAAIGADISSEARTFKPLGSFVRDLVPVNEIIHGEMAALC